MEAKIKQPPYLSDGGIIEVDPLVELGVVDEGGVVFAVVADDGRQVESRQRVPITAHHRVEHL